MTTQTIQAPLKMALSIREFSQQYGLSLPSIYREINEGKIKPIKIRSKTFFDMEEVARWYEAVKNATNDNHPV